MKSVSRNIVASLALLTMMAAGSGFAIAQTSPKETAVKQTAPAPALNKVELQSTADKAATRIQASDSDKKELLAASRAKNTDQARTLLLKNGFTAKQLEGAKIDFKDSTGGSANAMKVKVTISASCCPATITITIKF